MDGESDDSLTPVVTDAIQQSSEPSSSENDSNSTPKLAQIDFDDLKNAIETNETISMTNSTTTETSQSNEAAVQIENNNESVDHTVLNVCKIKLVNIENLLDKRHLAINAKISDGDTIKLSSESSSDQVLSKYVRKRPTPKKRLTKSHRNAQSKRSSYAECDSSESDDVPKRNTIKSNENAKQNSTGKIPQNIYAAKVRLTKLPSNMEPLLKRHNLIEICDRHQNIIASRKRTHCTEEVHNQYFHIVFFFSHSLSC